MVATTNKKEQPKKFGNVNLRKEDSDGDLLAISDGDSKPDEN